MDRTIQSLFAVTILLASILALIYWGSCTTDTICAALLVRIDDCLTAAQAGDIPAAANALSSFRSTWDSKRLLFAATQNHEDIDAVNTALQAAALQLSDDCIDESYAEIARIRDTLKKMREIQRLTLENIL